MKALLDCTCGKRATFVDVAERRRLHRCDCGRLWILMFRNGAILRAIPDPERGVDVDAELRASIPEFARHFSDDPVEQEIYRRCAEQELRPLIRVLRVLPHWIGSPMITRVIPRELREAGYRAHRGGFLINRPDDEHTGE
jgi:hypothetical protein